MLFVQHYRLEKLNPLVLTFLVLLLSSGTLNWVYFLPRTVKQGCLADNFIFSGLLSSENRFDWLSDFAENSQVRLVIRCCWFLIFKCFWLYTSSFTSISTFNLKVTLSLFLPISISDLSFHPSFWGFFSVLSFFLFLSLLETPSPPSDVIPQSLTHCQVFILLSIPISPFTTHYFSITVTPLLSFHLCSALSLCLSTNLFLLFSVFLFLCCFPIFVGPLFFSAILLSLCLSIRSVGPFYFCVSVLSSPYRLSWRMVICTKLLLRRWCKVSSGSRNMVWVKGIQTEELTVNRFPTSPRCHPQVMWEEKTIL